MIRVALAHALNLARATLAQARHRPCAALPGDRTTTAAPRTRPAALIVFALAALVASAPPALAQCRLALSLALDVSSSVDEAEHRLQREGLAAALADPEVRRAVLDGGNGLVYLSIYEWSGKNQQSLIVDWIALTDENAIDAVIAKVLTAPRSHDRFPTALGYALGFGATLMQAAPPCDRQVIDVSGDGITNDGFRPKLAYRHFPFDRITVNGLAVLGSDPRVIDYYRGEVLHGPGAFLETAEGYAGYKDAMARKLFREVNALVMGDAPPATANDRLWPVGGMPVTDQ